MKLVIENAKLGVTTQRQIENGQIEHNSEVLYLGGRAFVKNPKKVAPGDYSQVVVEVEVKNDATAWASKDKTRSGALIRSSLVFGDVVEATPLKK